MRNWWKTRLARIDALSMRERAMIFVTVLGTFLVLADSLWLSPAQLRQKQLELSFKKQSGELSELRKQLLLSMPVKPSAGSELSATSERMGLVRQLETVNSEIASMTAAPAIDLPKVLVQFLRRQEGLTLERAATLDFANPKAGAGFLAVSSVGTAAGLQSPEMALNSLNMVSPQVAPGKDSGPFREAAALVEKVLPLATQKAASGSIAQQLKNLNVAGTAQPTAVQDGKSSLMEPTRAETGNLSRRGMELTVSGPYLELMRYVQTLEKALPALRWGQMKLVSDKATSRLTLQVFLVELSP